MSLIRSQQGQSALQPKGERASMSALQGWMRKKLEACLQKGAEAGFLVFHWLFIAMLKHQDEEHLGEESSYLAYTSVSQYIINRSKGTWRQEQK